MSKPATRPFDAAEFINSDDDARAYLHAAEKDGDPDLISAARGDIARAGRSAAIAAPTGASDLETDTIGSGRDD